MSINYCLNNIGMLATTSCFSNEDAIGGVDDVKRPFQRQQSSLKMPDLKYFMKYGL